jgi:hypothetical protein
MGEPLSVELTCAYEGTSRTVLVPRNASLDLILRSMCLAFLVSHDTNNVSVADKQNRHVFDAAAILQNPSEWGPWKLLVGERKQTKSKKKPSTADRFRAEAMCLKLDSLLDQSRFDVRSWGEGKALAVLSVAEKLGLPYSWVRERLFSAFQCVFAHLPLVRAEPRVAHLAYALPR